MSDDLASLGTQVVAISPDTPEQIEQGLQEHGLEAIFLSDRDLHVTDLFGLRNLALQIRPRGLAGLPVPTTLVVDAEGVVTWKHEATDVTRIAQPDTVRAQLARTEA